MSSRRDCDWPAGQAAGIAGADTVKAGDNCTAGALAQAVPAFVAGSKFVLGIIEAAVYSTY